MILPIIKAIKKELFCDNPVLPEVLIAGVDIEVVWGPAATILLYHHHEIQTKFRACALRNFVFSSSSQFRKEKSIFDEQNFERKKIRNFAKLISFTMKFGQKARNHFQEKL